MLKAVVFDDEYIVLQGFRTMIDWSSYGIELVGTAGDGLSALSLFRTHHPDIIFTDIRMPGMDGLQLIEEVMKEAPETVCIVFSGFNEYQYVKRAIHLGVVDYIEKPITIPMIENTIRKTIDRISQQQEVTSLKLKWEQSRLELLEKATLDLLLKGAEAEQKWKDCFGVDAERVVGVTVLALSSNDQPLHEHSTYRAIYLRNGTERLIAVFHFHLPAEKLWEQLLTWSEQSEATLGTGRTYPQVTEAFQSYKEALRALRYSQFMEESGWIRFQDLGETITTPEGLSEREEAIIFYMRSGDKLALLQQIDHFIQWMQSEKLDPEVAEREMLKLIYLAMEVSKEIGGQMQGTPKDIYMPHVEIREMAARGKMAEWFRGQIEMIMDSMLYVRQNTKHAAVEMASKYMEQHYGSDITLQEVAKHVGMNSTYFSSLFKEEMGESYIKYLTRYRMERAKLMLRQGLTVNDVSEKVGYYTYRHFSEVFKKYVGVTPGQYKDK